MRSYAQHKDSFKKLSLINSHMSHLDIHTALKSPRWNFNKFLHASNLNMHRMLLQSPTCLLIIRKTCEVFFINLQFYKQHQTFLDNQACNMVTHEMQCRGNLVVSFVGFWLHFDSLSIMKFSRAIKKVKRKFYDVNILSISSFIRGAETEVVWGRFMWKA